MKLFFRYFFRTLRIILEPILLFWNAVFVPKGIVRPPEEQAEVDKKTQHLALYQFNSCPFCIKVRREMKRQSLNISLLDTQHDQKNKDDLLMGGGQVKVPCLKISDENGQLTWLYESNDIIRYLQENFAK